MKKSHGILTVVGVLAVFGLIVSKQDKNATPTAAATEAASEQVADTPEENIIEATVVDAKDLAVAYEKNEARAQQIYGKQYIAVYGKIESISLDFQDEPVVILKGAPGEFSMSTVHLSGISNDAASTLDKGQTVDAICNDVGEIIGSPMLHNCFLVQDDHIVSADKKKRTIKYRID